MRMLALLAGAVLALSACRGVTGANVPLAASNAGSRAGACSVSRFAAPYAPAYAKTVWPSEKHDQWRTAAVAAGLPAKIRKITAKSVALPPVPVWGYVGLDGNIYVLGGQPYGLDIYTKLILGNKSSLKKLLAESLAYSETVTPYVARINPVTMNVTILNLTQKRGVNYIGGMLVDSNGYLYTVARAVLYKIDPKTFSIVASKKLPLAPNTGSKLPNKLTAYNGMQATADGDLILKGFGPFGNNPGVIVRVDPNDLSIKAQTQSIVVAGARIALASNNGKEYVYLAGATDSIRFLTTPRGFTLDGAFSQQYLFPNTGNTEGTSEVYMGNGVVFANNTTFTATAPIDIFAQAASDGSIIDSEPAFTGSKLGWNWMMPSGDPFKSGIATVQDQLSGRVSAFVACAGGASTKKIWEDHTIDDSAGLAINTASGQVYADDHRCASTRICKLSLVVLDLHTGRQIARSEVAGTEPTIGQIFIGPRNAVFHLATDTDRPNGYITRITSP